MIKIYEADNVIDAQLICDWLRDDGIQARVQGGYLSGAIGELPADTLISVWIQDPIYKLRARELIKDFEAERAQTPLAQQCKHCGEHAEGNYSLCWKCGAPLC